MAQDESSTAAAPVDWAEILGDKRRLRSRGAASPPRTGNTGSCADESVPTTAALVQEQAASQPLPAEDAAAAAGAAPGSPRPAAKSDWAALLGDGRRLRGGRGSRAAAGEAGTRPGAAPGTAPSQMNVNAPDFKPCALYHAVGPSAAGNATNPGPAPESQPTELIPGQKTAGQDPSPEPCAKQSQKSDTLAKKKSTSRDHPVVTHGCQVEATEAWSGPPSGPPGYRYLDLQPGDRLVLTHPAHENYFAGRNLVTQEEGWFPVEAVQLVKSAPECTPERTPEDMPSPPPSAEFEAWHAYQIPETGRLWFWKHSTGESFLADDPPPSWSVFRGIDGHRWWWNNETHACFWEYASILDSIDAGATAAVEVAGVEPS